MQKNYSVDQRKVNKPRHLVRSPKKNVNSGLERIKSEVFGNYYFIFCSLVIYQ